MKSQIKYIIILLLITCIELLSQSYGRDSIVTLPTNYSKFKDTIIIKNYLELNINGNLFFEYDDIIIKTKTSNFKLSNNTKLISNGINTDLELSAIKMNSRKIFLNKFFALYKGASNSDKYFIILTANDTTSIEYAPSLIVIEVDIDGRITLLLDKINFKIYDITDIDNNKQIDFVGKECISQFIDENIELYNPYVVYTYKDGKIIHNSKLTHEYNLNNYYGWFDVDCTKDYVVAKWSFLNKPLIITLEDAYKINDVLKKYYNIQR